MGEAHVPFTGLVWKLSMSARHFDALIKRYVVFAGRPTEKVNLARYLISEGIPVPSAKKLLQRKFRLREIMEKIQFLESIRLDPAIYGVIRIPPKIYANVLDVPLYLLKGAKRKGGLKTRVLDPLEDAYAAKQLNGLFPKWREMQKIKSFRPATILKKVKAAELRGLTPTVYLLANYSVESIKEGRAKKAQYVAKGRREPKK